MTDAPTAPVLHPPVRPEWLAGLAENVLEPDLPIVDAHHHLWSRGEDYLADEFLSDTGSGHNVVASVFVQCSHGYRTEGPEELRVVGETEAIVELAKRADARQGATRVAAAIVGFAELRLGGAVDRVLEAQVEAGQGRFRGIRRMTARDDGLRTHHPLLPPGLLGDATFREGFARLAALDLSYDAWIYHVQLPELTALARSFPDSAIVLNHLGGPLAAGAWRGRRAEVFPLWRDHMRALARCENVHVKLGGMGMALMGFDFHRQPLPPSSGELALHWRPYVETCIELFGSKRCMFESNFPVDKGMVGYRALWNAFKRLTGEATPSEKQDLFCGTAANFYRIGGLPGSA